MITIEQIQKAEATGQYQFPFINDSAAGIAVRDENISFDQFCKTPENWFAQEYMGKRHKFSLEEMKGFWLCIEVQRKAFKAISMVVSGKYKGINQGLRELGIF
jgi:hypothetical protein